MKLKNYAILLSFLLGGSAFVKAQDIALKSNILYDASGTINLGAEVGLAPDGRLMYQATIMGGSVRMVVRGNIGCCNLRHVIGSVIVLPVILWAFMLTVDNTMWVT